jgi:hypothetical protein
MRSCTVFLMRRFTCFSHLGMWILSTLGIFASFRNLFMVSSRLLVPSCHIPKFWNVKKNRNHVCLNWLKFHKELKFLF